MKIFLLSILLIIFLHEMVYPQYNGKNIAISTNFSFNTTASIYLSPDAEEIIAQTNSFRIEHIYSYSFEIRYRVNEAIILGLSGEIMEGSGKGRNITPKQYIVKDGFELYPFELSVYYFLPFSTENFKFYLGGGLGLYTGKRTRQIGDVNFVDVSSELGYGIHVSTGMDYMIFNSLSVRGEFRFRDPDFRITNRYSSTQGIYNGTPISLPKDNIASKINLDGITFRIGVVYHLSL